MFQHDPIPCVAEGCDDSHAHHVSWCGSQVSSANIVALLEAASAAPRDRSASSGNGSGSTVAGWQAGDAASSTRGGASLLTADDFVNTRRAGRLALSLVNGLSAWFYRRFPRLHPDAVRPALLEGFVRISSFRQDLAACSQY